MYARPQAHAFGHAQRTWTCKHATAEHRRLLSYQSMDMPPACLHRVVPISQLRASQAVQDPAKQEDRVAGVCR